MTQPHDDFANYWRLQFPSHSIRLYAPLTGQLKDLITHANFDFEVTLSESDSWAEHPF